MAVNFPRRYDKAPSMQSQTRTLQPRPYYVSYKDTTPMEPTPGWYWAEEVTTDAHQVVNGPYLSHTEAMRDIQERT